jgi:lipopolysaccharide transport system ATP-binding protein
MGRMHEVGRGGTTVLFVSHNMPAIEALCTRGILLDRGQVVTDGKVYDVVREYHRRVMETQSIDSDALWNAQGPGREKKLIRSMALLDQNGEPTNYLPLGGRLVLRIGFHAEEPIEAPSIGIGFDDTLGQRLLTVSTPVSSIAIPRLTGLCTVHCEITQFPLAPGDYWVKIAAGTAEHASDTLDQALRFTVVDGAAFGEGRGYQLRGVCVAPSKWARVESELSQQ